MKPLHQSWSRRRMLGGLSVGLLPWACKPTKARAEALPELGSLGSFRLVNQAGVPVSEATLRGQVWVAAFLFTRCPTVCPKIMQRLARLQNTAKAKHIDVKFVCFSVDPDFDTPQVLKAYAERYGADFTRWSLLTGDSKVIQHTVTEGFKVGLEGTIQEGKEHLGITHGSHLVLVDRKLRIRGYYRSQDEDKMRELLLHAQDLVAA